MTLYELYVYADTFYHSTVIFQVAQGSKGNRDIINCISFSLKYIIFLSSTVGVVLYKKQKASQRLRSRCPDLRLKVNGDPYYGY